MDTKHYTLSSHERTDLGMRGKGAGGIDMCQKCWERIAKPHMKKKKGEPM